MRRLTLNPVAVEKLDLSKLVRKTLRQDALQTTFSFSWTFSIPQILGLLREEESFNSHA